MTDIETLLKPIIDEARMVGLFEGRHERDGALPAMQQTTLDQSRKLLAQNVATLVTTLKMEMGAEMLAESQAAMNYVCALVVKAGGAVEFSEADLRDVDAYQLERADPESGGLVLRAFKPQEAPKIEAPSQAPKAIILPEGLH